MNNVMEINIPKEYAMAYVEILEILKRMEEVYYEKIPKDLIEKFETFKSNNYVFEYDESKELKEQKLMSKTKDILAVLFIDYLTNEKEKEIIKEKQQEYKARKEKQLQENYDINKIFESRKQNVKVEDTSYPVEYKKLLYLRIIDKIKEIFKRT